MTSNTFQLIDLDRTLFDTTALISAVLEAVAKSHPDVSAELEQQSKAAYEDERTFMLFRHLRERYGDNWFEALIADIIREKGAESFMLPGAHERLNAADSLTSARPSWGIFTYGDSIDQQMKIRIAGLEDAPVHIVEIADKGDLISSWQTAEGGFQLPDDLGGAVVDRITFEDDKLAVFKGVPEKLIGVWVTRREDAEARLSEANVANVVIARDLHESLRSLRERLDSL